MKTEKRLLVLSWLEDEQAKDDPIVEKILEEDAELQELALMHAMLQQGKSQDLPESAAVDDQAHDEPEELAELQDDLLAGIRGVFNKHFPAQQKAPRARKTSRLPLVPETPEQTRQTPKSLFHEMLSLSDQNTTRETPRRLVQDLQDTENNRRSSRSTSRSLHPKEKKEKI